MSGSKRTGVCVMRLSFWIALLSVGAVGCTDPGEPDPTPGAEAINTPTSVPVLQLPAEYMDHATLITEERWYAIHYDRQGLNLNLHATTSFVEPPEDIDLEEVEHNVQIRGAEGFETMDEGIRVVTWIENGAAYDLKVTCEEEDDTRCTESAFALELAGQLEAAR